MLQSAFHLFILRKLPWSSFNFPRWQALLGLALTGVLMGLNPDTHASFPGIADRPAMLLGIAWAYYLLVLLVYVPIAVGFMRWWMQRGGRWDGKGDIFNLIVTSWLVVAMLSTGLAAVGIPLLGILLMWLYSIRVTGNALSGAIPKASLAYSIGGIVVTIVPSLIVEVLCMVLVNIALTALGVPPALTA